MSSPVILLHKRGNKMKDKEKYLRRSQFQASPVWATKPVVVKRKNVNREMEIKIGLA